MAYLTGKDGLVKVAAATVVNIKEFTLDTGRDFEDTAALGDDWHESQPTLGKWSGSFSGEYDNTDTNGQLVLQAAALNGAQVALKLYVDVDNYFSGNARVAMSLNAAAGAHQKATYTFTGDGALSYT